MLRGFHLLGRGRAVAYHRPYIDSYKPYTISRRPSPLSAKHALAETMPPPSIINEMMMMMESPPLVLPLSLGPLSTKTRYSKSALILNFVPLLTLSSHPNLAPNETPCGHASAPNKNPRAASSIGPQSPLKLGRCKPFLSTFARVFPSSHSCLVLSRVFSFPC